MQELEHIDKQAFAVDLSIARGLAYYTGTVYETRFAEYPAYPSICGGGRYDNLVRGFREQTLTRNWYLNRIEPYFCKTPQESG